MSDGRTESIRVRVTPAEKAGLQELANKHTDGNVGELMRNRALGIADVAGDRGEPEPTGATVRPPAETSRPAPLDPGTGEARKPGPVERVFGP